MDKKDLLDIMEYYLFDQIVKKRTSINGNTYFFVKDDSLSDNIDEDVFLTIAFYSEMDKTLYLFAPRFTQDKKIKSFPTYESGGSSMYAKVEGYDVLDLTVDWFKGKFPELDIRDVGLMNDYMFEIEINDRFEEDMVDIGPSDISEELKRIKELLK